MNRERTFFYQFDLEESEILRGLEEALTTIGDISGAEDLGRIREEGFPLEEAGNVEALVRKGVQAAVALADLGRKIAELVKRDSLIGKREEDDE